MNLWASPTVLGKSMKKSLARMTRAPRAPARLADLQRLLRRLITAPEGVADGLARERSLDAGGLGTIIGGDERLSPVERLDIYANMYFYRLLDILREDFPATLAVLGDNAFHNLITGYLLEYPPTEPSVHHCGRYLADYLRGHPFARTKPWLADLAALERAHLDVFHAADSVALDAAAMKAIAPERWPRLKLHLVPAAKILMLDWNVTKVLDAIAAGRKPRRPERGKFATLVFRRSFDVAHRILDHDEARALAAAIEGTKFAHICELAAGKARGPRAARKINSMLERWLGDGLMTLDAARKRRV
jgi:hypothetical protein